MGDQLKSSMDWSNTWIVSTWRC